MTTTTYNFEDTICAVATPPGVGGIAVIRVCGPEAIAITDKLWKGTPLAKAKTHTAHLGNIVAPDGIILDQAVATVFRAPRSYTGDDTVELSIHGSRWIQREVIKALTQSGCRIALPGEYTRRACASGRLDLTQAEAVADVIAARNRASHDLAINQMRGGVTRRLETLRIKLLDIAALLELELDFSDQEVEFAPRQNLIALAAEIDTEINRLIKSFDTGAAIKDGFPIVILGPVNAGKSALLNTLIDDDRAIVSNTPGTTRDIIEDTLEIGPYTVRFLDTAGIRATTDTVEQTGIDRALAAARKATIIIYLIDPLEPQQPSEITRIAASLAPPDIIPVINKTDIADRAQLDAARRIASETFPEHQAVEISALRQTNIAILINEIENRLQRHAHADSDTIITASRHAEALSAAAASNARMTAALAAGIPEDLVAQDLRETLHHLATITGAITTPAILSRIFSTFCIGK